MFIKEQEGISNLKNTEKYYRFTEKREYFNGNISFEGEGGEGWGVGWRGNQMCNVSTALESN